MEIKIFVGANVDELAEIAYKLRYWTKKWHVGHGAILLRNKKYWEDKMDFWLYENIEQFNKSLTDE